MRHLAVLAFLFVSACGVAYIPAKIRQGEGDAAVQVVPLTNVSLLDANRGSSYMPIRLGPVNLNEALAAVGGVETTDPDFTSIRIYLGGELYQIPLDDFNGGSQLQRLELLDGDSVYAASN